ncbi:hypothetical protein [uncultured Lamprocystis sp.]|jgi:hypothetical protein|uniref:hypothetical protein n=1 Tax=uncultured Lamprocystis sp. TaxID=543132 RepID=UPI0025D4925E|nr:hypothetical protein [uncultured Lamprocystis sp.]
MTAVEIGAIALIIAAGWGLTSAEIGYPETRQDNDMGPVGKCRGLCRGIPHAGFPAGAPLAGREFPCAGEQTALMALCKVF